MLFKHAEIFTPQGFVRGAFTVEDGRFGEILPQSPDMPGIALYRCVRWRAPAAKTAAASS